MFFIITVLFTKLKILQENIRTHLLDSWLEKTETDIVIILLCMDNSSIEFFVQPGIKVVRPEICLGELC